MNFKVNTKYWLATAAVATLLGFASNQAKASNSYPGDFATLTGSSGAAKLFTLVGTDTIQVDSGNWSKQWYLTIGANTTQLMGIERIYLVNPDGTAGPGPTGFVDGEQTSNAYSSITSAGTKHDWYYDAPTGSFKDYHDIKGNGTGANPGSPWIRVGDPSLVTPIPKFTNDATLNGINFGQFKFNISDPPHPLSYYDIGIDYLLKNGDTGNAYFAQVPGGGGGGSGDPVPEPVFMQLGSLLAMGGIGTLIRRKAKASRS